MLVLAPEYRLFVACYLAKDIDKIIYTHVENQHPDSLRIFEGLRGDFGKKD